MNFSIFETPDIKTPISFSSSQEVYEKMKDYKKADREIFLLLFLDAKNTIIKIEPHTIGTVDSSAVYPREVFRSALIHNASSIICVHNHPTGDHTPSEADREITKELVKAGELLQIKILDHIVLGKEGYFSFSDEDLIDDYESKV